jgi:hypothetical protein
VILKVFVGGGGAQLRSVVAYVAMATVCMFFLLPVTFVSGLSTLQNLVNTMPWLAPIARNDFLSGLIEGYLPGVALTVSLLGVPYIFLFLSHYQCVLHLPPPLPVLA